MRDDVDEIVTESLMLGACHAFRDMAEELLELRRGWITHGASRDAVDWLDGLIAKAGWWSGRLAAGCDRSGGRVTGG